MEWLPFLFVGSVSHTTERIKQCPIKTKNVQMPAPPVFPSQPLARWPVLKRAGMHVQSTVWNAWTSAKRWLFLPRGIQSIWQRFPPPARQSAKPAPANASSTITRIATPVRQPVEPALKNASKWQVMPNSPSFHLNAHSRIKAAARERAYIPAVSEAIRRKSFNHNKEF